MTREPVTISGNTVEELVAAINRLRDGREAAMWTVASLIEVELEALGVLPARTTSGRSA